MEYANAHGKAWSSFEKLGEPVNKFMNKIAGLELPQPFLESS